MARKPTRFWSPAQRLLLRAQETARSFISKQDSAPNLDDVRPRLQHYLRAMYGEGVTIESLGPAKKTGWAMRTLQKMALVRERASSESDSQFICLPASLPRPRNGVSALEQYRVVAVQHAERIRRRSASYARDVTTDLERDLYQLAEAASIDAQIVASQPGLRSALDAARAESIAERPRPRFRSAIELRVEEMFRRAWSKTDHGAASDKRASTNDDTLASGIPQHNDAHWNAGWARRTAVELESKYGRKAAQTYRRVPEFTLWQTTIKAQLPEEQTLALETETRPRDGQPQPDSWNQPLRSALPGGAKSQSPQKKPGNTPDKSDGGNSSSDKDSGGDERSGDGGDEKRDEDGGDEKREGDGGDENSAAMEDRAADAHRTRPTKPEPLKNRSKSSQQNNKNAVDTQDAGPRSANSDGGQGGHTGVAHSEHTVDDALLTEGTTFRYPEWDFKTQNFHPTGTIVRVMPPSLASGEWAKSALQEHAREIQRAKRQFERLRSHRSRLRRQLQGDELDLEACVAAMVDRQMCVAPSDRLYSHVRPGRRDLAITLLIDVSGSTGDAVEGEQRVIDLERVATLVATSAFDALGDDYSILAFSSASASNVRVHTLKEFGERNSSVVMQRISAVAPHGTTRLGAAVRHATATLCTHPAPHRLLLILSDGKPHDYDWYFTDYAVQDSRHAIMNARLQGIHPFCITVDSSDGETYLPEIFGSSGYRVVSKPSQLSQALLQAVQRMIGASS